MLSHTLYMGKTHWRQASLWCVGAMLSVGDAVLVGSGRCWAGWFSLRCPFPKAKQAPLVRWRPWEANPNSQLPEQDSAQ